MTNSEQQLFEACKDEPSLVFTLIKQGHYEVIEQLINESVINVNLVDTVGNDVVTRLLKAQQYELVIQLMKKKNWDVNHQNEEGNTFAHILAHDNSCLAVKVVEQLVKKKNFVPNIKNNKGETALDRSINNNYLCTAFKILGDKRFNSIDVTGFKNLFNACIKNTYYGKYSKINNFETIVGNLEKKDLDPTMTDLVNNIVINYDILKNNIMNNNFTQLEYLINSHLVA